MPVDVVRHGTVLVITLQRPAKRNAIDSEMTFAIEAAIDQVESDESVRVGVITGSGPAFSAGTDLIDTGVKTTQRGGEYGIIRRHRTKPLIAAVEGLALGGGFEIALACDLIVAARNAEFGLPETRRGVLPTSGALFRAPAALPRNVAVELMLTGERLGAERAWALGLVNVISDPGGAVEAALVLADKIRLGGPHATTETLTAVRELTGWQDRDGWRRTEQAKQAVLAGPDAAEGKSAFAEKRDPAWVVSMRSGEEVSTDGA